MEWNHFLWILNLIQLNEPFAIMQTILEPILRRMNLQRSISNSIKSDGTFSREIAVLTING